MKDGIFKHYDAVTMFTLDSDCMIDRITGKQCFFRVTKGNQIFDSPRFFEHQAKNNSTHEMLSKWHESVQKKLRESKPEDIVEHIERKFEP